MNTIDRRKVLTGIICGGAVVTLGLSAMPKTAKSTPLGAVKSWRGEDRERGRGG